MTAGEQIRPFGSAHFVAPLVLLTFGALFVIGICIATFVAPGFVPKDDVFGRVFAFIFAALWVALAVRFFWGNLLFSSLRLSESGLEYRNGRRREYSIRYADILAVSRNAPARSKGHAGVRVLYAAEDARSGARWLSLDAELGWRRGLADAVADELVRRAQLAPIRPAKQDGDDRGTTLWTRPALRRLPVSTYTVSQMPRYGLLALALACLCFSLFALGTMVFQWDSAEHSTRDFVGAGWITLISLVGLGAWVIHAIRRRRTDVVWVGWDEREMTIRTRDGAVTSVTWSNVLGAELAGEASPNRLTLDVAGRSTPVQLALSEAPEALAFLDMLSSKARIERER